MGMKYFWQILLLSVSIKTLHGPRPLHVLWVWPPLMKILPTPAVQYLRILWLVWIRKDPHPAVMYPCHLSWGLSYRWLNMLFNLLSQWLWYSPNQQMGMHTEMWHWAGNIGVLINEEMRSWATGIFSLQSPIIAVAKLHASRPRKKFTPLTARL
jgi:hypothetical protein